MKRMEKAFLRRVIGIVSLFMLVLLVLQTLIQRASSRNHFYRSADILISQIEEILKSNEAGERNLTESLKNDYIIRAQACSYIIENCDIAEQDVQELKRIAELLEVDEIHLFDTDGVIYAGTIPKYFGYSFDSGEQMGFFKPILSDYGLSLCQDVTPNTAEGKQMMYALVWREDRKGLVQIGLTPTRLLEQMERNKASNFLSGIPTNDNIYLVADHSTGEIIGCTQSGYQGKYLQDAEIDRGEFSGEEASHFEITLEGETYLAAFRVCGSYEIGVCQAGKDIYGGTYLGSLIIFVYLSFASVVIISVVGIMARKEREQEKRYQGQLENALKQANAASEAKTAFLANMSHDIRTPMNAILGFTDLLEKHINNTEKREDYIAKIKTSGGYLLELINNVLEMSRIESGRAVVDEAIWSVEQFQNTLVSVFREEVDRKNLKFQREIRVEHAFVWCDSTKVQEIFFNLVSNAVKYTPEGGTIAMRLIEQPCEREGYAVYKTEAEDTGIGMSEEFLPHIFEEFARERDTTHSKVGGTGLGLPIAKKLVDMMGGSITVESEVGKGTRFTVILSHRIADKEGLEKTYEEEAQNSGKEFAGKRLLLAEDNELNAEIAMELLEELGFEVEHAEDGVICVDMVQRMEPGYYDLILMDIQMPNMNGYQATERIRGLSGPQKDIPIVAMTANAFEEDKRHAFAVGMNGHVAKPIDVPKLIETLAEFLT